MASGWGRRTKHDPSCFPRRTVVVGAGQEKSSYSKIWQHSLRSSLCVSSDGFVMEPRASWEGEEGPARVCPCRGSGADRGRFFEVTAQARAQQLFLEELGILDTNNQDLKTS